MVDPGRPFGVAFGDLVSALEVSLTQGVEQDRAFEFVFLRSVLVYPLPPETSSVAGVSGLIGRDVVLFEPGRDYVVGASRLTWLPRVDAEGGDEGTARHPDDGSRVQVAFRYREQPAGLSDLNPGSVAGSLARAVARELTVLYAQLDEAYRRAFLDTATGAALDNVVALVGVVRNPALPATGQVSFSRRRATSDRVVVPIGTALEDATGRRFETTDAAVIDAGTTEGSATITVVEPGPRGNVNAGAVVVMPTPPTGVDAVTNPLPISGGEDPEADDAVRERARHALERAGNATMGALEFTVREVDGVEDVTVIDRTVDPDIPLGEVRVRYSSGAGSPERLAEIDDEVARALERTRAAGVLVQAARVRLVNISGRLIVMPSRTPVGAVASAFTEAVRAALRDLDIGEHLSLRRLGALAYQTSGLAELTEAQLTFARQPPLPPGVDATGHVDELLPVSASEKIEPGTLNTVVVTGIDAQPGAEPRSLRLRLLSGSQPVDFDDVAAHVRVQVKVTLRSTPTLPPVLVADVTRSVEFRDTNETTLTLSDEDLDRYDPSEHADVADLVVSLAAYDAVVPAAVALELAP